MQWRPAPDGYTLTFDADLEGHAILTQASRGDFDSAGLAPVRYTDLRARRATLATNFQREAGRISFSGSNRQLPQVQGGQDLLS
ncbi:MAG TPA: hypothetical protein VF319_04095 [Caldimonas sp.]